MGSLSGIDDVGSGGGKRGVLGDGGLKSGALVGSMAVYLYPFLFASVIAAICPANLKFKKKK